VGLQQQSSRKAGLLRMRLLLVRHDSSAVEPEDGEGPPQSLTTRCL
jgi:hypothetical protein